MVDMFAGNKSHLESHRITDKMSIKGAIFTLTQGHGPSSILLINLMKQGEVGVVKCLVMLDLLGIYEEDIEAMYIENGSSIPQFMQALQDKVEATE